MNFEIFKIILKEIGWFIAIYIFGAIFAFFLFLLLESLGFFDSIITPTDEFYGLSPVFFNAYKFAFTIALLFFAVLRMDFEKEKIDEWKKNRIKSNFFIYFGLGIFAALSIWAFDNFEYFTLLKFFEESEVSKDFWSETRNFDFGEKLFFLLDSVILIPIAEELYFRQSVLGSILRKGYPNFAIFFSCAFFALLHDFLHIFAYLFSAVIFALLYTKTRSILPSILAHSIINFVSFYFILFG